MSVIQAAVIGKPIRHSLSPAIFTFLSHRLSLNSGDSGNSGRNPWQSPRLDYAALEIQPQELPEFIQELKRNPHWIGVNITTPYKEMISEFLDHRSLEVQTLGATNVIHKVTRAFRPGLIEGKQTSGVIDSRQTTLKGHNTDIYGILMTLKSYSDQYGTLEGKRACVLGAGGAARAVLYALGKLKLARIDVINRTPSKALELIALMKRLFPSTQWNFTPLADSLAQKNKLNELPISLCVNATPQGMMGVSEGTPEDTPLFSQSFSPHAAAFDLIYHPENTFFLKNAKIHGLIPLGGLEMLVEQALATWKIWFGEHPLLFSQKEPLIQFLRNRPIFITGSMGSGKSSVGKALAHHLSKTCIDLDQRVELSENKTIGALFEEQGEAHFRKIEWREFQKIFLTSNSVIALGGGSLLHPEIRHLISKVGTLVYLRAKPSTLSKRLLSETQHRPLLARLKPNELETKIQALLQERESFYLQAPIQIDTDSKSIEEIASEIGASLDRQT